MENIKHLSNTLSIETSDEIFSFNVIEEVSSADDLLCNTLSCG